MIVGTRHRPAQKLGRPAFLLMSVIALLALACFPVLAHGEDSSGVQYSDSIPRAEGENAPSHHHQTPAKSSSTDRNGGAPAPGATGTQGGKDSTEGSEGDESSAKVGGVPAKGNDGGNGQSSPGGSANHANGASVQPGAQAKGATTSQKSDDGGSSPLIPVLIAILVLAAVSLGTVWYRQRRQGGPATPPASQKAS